MSDITKDLIELLQYLLPGFVTAWIFHGLTSFSRPSQFERVIQALIFTLFVQSFIYAAKALTLVVSVYGYSMEWSNSVEVVSSLIVAILLGFVLSHYTNNDKIHAWLRKKKITKESSYPSEWFGAFLKNITYVVLHFVDGRRLYGWILEWPSEQGKGHFLLTDVVWLDEDNNEKPLVGVERILVDSADVKMVEFMKKSWESE